MDPQSHKANPAHEHELDAAADRTSSSVLASLDAASEAAVRLRRVTEENECLAEEVLRNYEQLSLLFDVTHQVATLTRPDEIERLLLTRLRELLHVDAVDVHSSSGIRRRYDADNDRVHLAAHLAVDPPLKALIDQVRQQCSCMVRPLGDQNFLFGVLERLDNQVDVVLAARPRGNADFTSGDMRLTESLLTFGGQLISNAEMHERLRQISMETTRALVSAIDKKDHYTSGHSERVGFLSRSIGEALGMRGVELEELEWAGLLHDVGKIGVPEEILNKTGRLTNEEFDIIKQHPVMGYEILKPIQSFQHILDGVLYHHENPDGTGYPRGLAGDDIPMSARILHVVDVFDALTSNRSYRSSFTIDEALAIIRKDSGTKLDAQIVQTFFEVLDHLRTKNTNAFAAMFAHVTDSET